MGLGFATVKSILLKLLKAYGVFAVLNLLFKVLQNFWTIQRSRQLWKHVPGAPFDTLGNRIGKNAFRFHEYYREQALAFPTAPLVKSSGPLSEILCNTPESVKWMLHDEFENVTKLDAGHDYLVKLLDEFIGGNGIFVLRHGEALGGSLKEQSELKLENEKWFQERKIASRLFTKSNFEGLMYETFVDKAEKLVSRLNKVAESKEKVDLQELFFSFTMDSIEKLFFGNDVNTVEGGMSEYAKSFDAAHKAMIDFVVNNVFLQVANRLLLPYPFGKWTFNSDEHNIIATQLVRYFSPEIKIFKAAVKKLDQHVYKYIDIIRNDPKIGSRKDIMANFLNSKFGSTLSDRDLRDIVLNLTIAGRDTTACTLSWLFFELSQNQVCQEKLYKEISEKLEGRVAKPIDLESDNLPYLNGCLYEALRLHPPVPSDKKIAMKDLTYIDGTVIPKGTSLFFLPFSMGRNPSLFSDPDKFQPERWIPFSEKQRTLYEFPVFQAGPRFCLGKDMAQFEAKLLTSILVQNFKFDLLDGEADKIWYSMMLTMSISNHPKRETNNLWMLPQKRV